MGTPDLDTSLGTTTLATAEPPVLELIAGGAPATRAQPSGRDALIERVQAAVERELETTAPSVGAVARALGTSPRTLQRRLGERGLSFRDVVEQVRERHARVYLANADLSIAEIAQRLGYAEVSAFLRAFKRWTGTTPGRVRAAANDVETGLTPTGTD